VLHNRTELITWIRANVDDPAIQNALEWGAVKNLGGFRPLPTSKNPGWVVRVTSKRGHVHVIAVGVKGFRLYWFRLKEEMIDWSRWIGAEAENELYRGDRNET